MAFDSLTLSVLTEELRRSIDGAKINKIVQPERDEIVLTLFGGTTKKLVLSANPSINRLHFTTYNKENPLSAPNFCMLLRKHLTNASLINITQMPFERVVDFCLQSKNELGYSEQKHLIFELTGKTANLILTDENYTIYDTLKHLPMGLDAERIMLSGAKYEFFPSRSRVCPDDYARIKSILSSDNGDIDKVLLEKLFGVSTSTVAEMLFGIEKQNHSELNISRAIDGIKTYIDRLAEPNPNIVFCDGVPVDVFPFDYRSARGEKKFYATLNEAHDEFYFLKDRSLRTSQKTKHLSSVIKSAINRIEKKTAIQAQSLLDSRDNEKFKKYGDLILSNIYQIKPNTDKISVVDYYDENSPTIEISLDKSLSPQKNAQEYYKKYHKMKNTIAVTEKLLAENKEQLEYVKGVAEFLKFSTTEADLQEITAELTAANIIREKSGAPKKQPPVTPVKYYIDGFSVLVGKNNIQNDFLTNKTAKPNDVWLHTQSIHSAHVIIETNQKEVPDSVLVAAAEITAFYSPARNSGKTAIDYTLKKNLKKPPKTALGYVIYSIYNTLIVMPNEHTEYLKK